MTDNRHFINRYIWVYLAWDTKKQRSWFATFQSPDPKAHTLGKETPYHYNLSRNDVRYTIKADVELSRENAVAIAKECYECEFVNMPKELRRRQRK